MNWKNRLYETAAIHNAKVDWWPGRERFECDVFCVNAPKGHVWRYGNCHGLLSQWRNTIGPGWRKWAVQGALEAMAKGVVVCRKRGCGVCENDETESEAT